MTVMLCGHNGTCGRPPAVLCCATPSAALLPRPQMPDATLNMLLNITQPLMNQTGQLRWAINNVAGALGLLILGR